MAVCDPQALLSTNPCLSALDPFTLEVVITAQLCALYNNLDTGDPMTCDIEELLADSACFYGLSFQQLKVVQAQLLCNILSLL